MTDRRTPANDNELPKVHTVGLGNLRWRINDAFGRLSREEVYTASRPLSALHELVVQALAFMRANKSFDANSSVYVIGDVYGRDCKIGKAADPVSRLSQLQTGNPNLLFIHRVFWLPREYADTAESLAHRYAGGRCERLEGEWFSCDPSLAHAAIEQAISRLSGIKSYCVMTPTEQLMEVAS